MKTPAQRRTALIGKVHALAKRLGYDEATYRTLLLAQTGKTSCRDMTDKQLSRLAEALECLVAGKPMPEAVNAPQASSIGLEGQMLPTARQWETLAGMACRESWSGLDDFRLLSFALRTAKVASLSELSRAGMSKMISGLSRYLAQQKAKGEAA